MKYLLICLICFAGVSAFGQEATKPKLKEYLGVLTLPEKYQDEKNWTPKEEAIVNDHFQRLLRLKDEGVVVLAGRTDLALDHPGMMGLVVFYASDDAAAEQLMREDPAVKNKIMLAKVYPYGIAVSKCK